MRRKFERFLILNAALIMYATTAWAEAPKKIGEYDDWSAYVFTEGADNKVSIGVGWRRAPGSWTHVAPCCQPHVCC